MDKVDIKKLFKTLARLIILIFAFNFIALRLYFYSSVWYFDMIMHFLGGGWLGLLVMWIIFSKLFFENISLEFSFRLINQIVFGVLIIGVSWELYEILVNNIIFKIPFYILDTSSDVFFDLAGGTFAVFYFFFYFFKKITQNNENKIQLP